MAVALIRDLVLISASQLIYFFDFFIYRIF